MRLIGYARVATVHQNLDRQLGALRAARCKTIFAEKASGKDVKGPPELERAIDELGAGDVLVQAEWDRATRSMMDGLAIMQRVPTRGADQWLDKPHLDLTTADRARASAQVSFDPEERVFNRPKYLQNRPIRAPLLQRIKNTP